MTKESSAPRPRATQLDQPHPTGGYEEILTFPDGAAAYFRDGVLHREDGPAWMEANGALTWLRNGRLHRDIGPAVIRADGMHRYWLHGMQASETVWWKSQELD